MSGSASSSGPVRRVAVFSMHTSPLAQPGAGDGGGMNVYVRALACALARAGVACDVYTRAEHPDQVPVVEVEPGFRVVHVEAGPRAPVPRYELLGLVDAFVTEANRLLDDDLPVEVLHANYWLSGLAGHRIKHELDLPLVTTFHTLARVKAESGDNEPELRVRAETEIIGCADAIKGARSPQNIAAHQVDFRLIVLSFYSCRPRIDSNDQ